jgi:hypothetical protein
MASRLWASVAAKIVFSFCLVALLIAGCSPTGAKTPAAVTTEKIKTPTEQYAALLKNAKGKSK